MPTSRSFTTTLRLLALAAALTAAAAHADDYSDVSQLVRAGKFADAQVKAEQYLAAKPRDPQMRFLKGIIQAETGKKTEAIQTFTRLTEDYPELPEPYNNLAVLYAAQNQFDKARTALEMAIRTNPSYATAHENLGDIYARLAGQAYSKALQLDSANQAVAPKLALIHDMLTPNPGAAKGGSTTSVKAPTTVGTTAGIPAKPGTTAAATPPTTTVASTPVPASAPVVTPVATPAITPTPAPAPTVQEPPPPTANAAQEIEAAVQAWANAWEKKNIEGYLNAYSHNFAPPAGLSRKEWEKQRRERILGKASIHVKVSQIRLQVNGDKAQAQFRQDYKADQLVVTSRKTLQLVKQGKRWLIVRESTGG